MESKQYNALFAFLWNIANDVLVHVFEKGDYKKIILPFMVQDIHILESETDGLWAEILK